jgi:hypothetical protein
VEANKVAELVGEFGTGVASEEIIAVVHGLRRDAYDYAGAAFERRAALAWAGGYSSQTTCIDAMRHCCSRKRHR